MQRQPQRLPPTQLDATPPFSDRLIPGTAILPCGEAHLSSCGESRESRLGVAARAKLGRILPRSR